MASLLAFLLHLSELVQSYSATLSSRIGAVLEILFLDQLPRLLLYVFAGVHLGTGHGFCLYVFVING